MKPMTTETTNGKPLSGLKVVDFTRVFAGPYCTMLLADLGADVVKIELPGEGDPLRTQGPPFLHGLGYTYLAANRNKRSVTLDMGTDEGRDIAWRLCCGADIVVENFRPGVMPRLGLDHERLAAANPRVIFASISGMGADGPDKDIGAFDLTIQAIGGYMSITGERGGAPIKLGTSAFDMIAGMNCQAAILAALLQRSVTGRGQKVETSLLEGEVAFLANAALEYLIGGTSPGKWGSEHPQQVPYKVFETADGWAVIGAGYQNIWEAFLGVIDRPDLASDPRFVDLAGRVTHRDALYAVLDPELRKYPAAELLARLDAAKVPCAPVHDMEQVFNHRQVLHRRMRQTVQHPVYGALPQVGAAAKYSGFEVEAGWTAPPLLGEHTAEVLGEWLGIQASDIERLQASKVI